MTHVAPATRSFVARRALLLTFAAALGTQLSPASAITLGAFQITASGEQKLNLQTGETELPQGGTATDSKNGLTLVGKTIRYLAGERLQATGATIKTAEGGTLVADTVVYDVKTGILKATGRLNYGSAVIKNLSADTMSLYTANGAVVASGNVKATAPALSASRVIALDGGKQVLLTGNYTLTYNGSRYANTGASGRLLLNGTSGKSSATARPPATQLRPFLPYLN